MPDLGFVDEEQERGQGWARQTSNFLSGLREDVTNAVGDVVLSPVSGALGPTGEKLARTGLGFLNPMPSSLTDAARDAAYIAVLGPFGHLLRQVPKVGGMAAGPLGRIAAGAAGAAGGAELEGKSPLEAGVRAVPGLAIGEGLGALGGNYRRGARQQAQDVEDVTSALNTAMRGQSPLEPNVPALWQRATAPRGQGSISEVASQNYKTMLQQVQAAVDPTDSRPIAYVGAINENRPSTIREVMDFLMEQSRAPKKVPMNERSQGDKAANRLRLEARETLLAGLEAQKDPVTGAMKPATQLAADRAAAQQIKEVSGDMFKNMTVSRLLRSPGVLAKDGTLDMERLQEAFKALQKSGGIPADVSVELQGAIFRGGQPPMTDRPSPETLFSKIGGGVGAMGGVLLGGLKGHPFLGMDIGRQTGKRLATSGPLYVGNTVGPSALGGLPGRYLGSQISEALEE